MPELMHVYPADIEKESFRIITKTLDEMGVVLDEKTAPIIKRVIHTTADFSFVESLSFSNDAIEKAHELIKNGATIVTDTNMTLAGINKSRLSKFGCDIKCFMADDEVAKQAKDRGITRAAVSMEKASKLDGPVIFSVGNAPTALIKIKELMDNEGFIPDFVIGVPVGFVNVEYSKEIFRDSNTPYIINFGKKGGSNVAAAIINALVLSMPV